VVNVKFLATFGQFLTHFCNSKFLMSAIGGRRSAVSLPNRLKSYMENKNQKQSLIGILLADSRAKLELKDQL